MTPRSSARMTVAASADGILTRVRDAAGFGVDADSARFVLEATPTGFTLHHRKPPHPRYTMGESVFEAIVPALQVSVDEAGDHTHIHLSTRLRPVRSQILCCLAWNLSHLFVGLVGDLWHRRARSREWRVAERELYNVVVGAVGELQSDPDADAYRRTHR